MQTTTRQGTVLTVHLAAIQPRAAGQPEPIVEFRYRGGILCSSYYLSHFMAIPAGTAYPLREGLCLEGGTFTRQELSADAVAACQVQCTAWLREVQA